MNSELDANNALDLNINLEELCLREDSIYIGEILDNEYLIGGYYDSLIIKSFKDIDDGKQINSKEVVIAECLERYYRLLIVYFFILEFIRKNNILFDKDKVIQERFHANLYIANRITVSNAYYYLNLVSNYLQFKDIVDDINSFYYDEFERIDRGQKTYYIESNYNKVIINRLNEQPLDTIKRLFDVTDNKLKYNDDSRSRCIALMDYNDNLYLSISGTSCDYDGSLIQGWGISSDYHNVYLDIKSTIIDYDYACHLNDNCSALVFDICFLHNSNPHASKRQYTIKDIVNFIHANYACCERKILSNVKGRFAAKEAKLFVKYIPCEKCIPFLEGMTNIIFADYKDYTSFCNGKHTLKKSLRKCSIKKGALYIEEEIETYLR